MQLLSCEDWKATCKVCHLLLEHAISALCETPHRVPEQFVTKQSTSAGVSAEMKFPKSSGRQLDHRGTLSCFVSSTAKAAPEVELRGKYTDSMAISHLDHSGRATSEKEVFRFAVPPVSLLVHDCK